MFRSRQIIATAALALCAATAAPAVARVPDDQQLHQVLPVWRVQGTHRCQHSLAIDAATGRLAGRTTTYGARCIEA